MLTREEGRGPHGKASLVLEGTARHGKGAEWHGKLDTGRGLMAQLAWSMKGVAWHGKLGMRREPHGTVSMALEESLDSTRRGLDGKGKGRTMRGG